VITVGLFVNATTIDINSTVESCGLDVVQLHGDESPAFCASQSKRVIKAIAVSSPVDLGRLSDYQCAILLDAKAPDGVYGGAGKTFDWSMLSGLKHSYPLILAGGLNGANINEALAAYDWYAVDVSSGVEKEKGIKDSDKLEFFCSQVQQFNVKDINNV
jgi:phosphoribosylanthranilate isomerase